MEGEKGLSGASSSARWNPTKEQIEILEGLYKQGIRTPSAEQIQKITGKLREYGSIEGKNVFYWFQNHKARQRQKERQGSFAYYRTLVRHSAPSSPPPPACATVLRSPYYAPVPQVGSVGLYQPQYPNAFYPAAMSATPTMTEFQSMWHAGERCLEVYNETPAAPAAPGAYQGYQQYSNNFKVVGAGYEAINGGNQTLQLFPLHPTGVLDDKSKSGSSLTSASGESESLEEGDDVLCAGDMTLYDFFGAAQRSI